MIAFVCAATIIVNLSTEPLNKRDRRSFEAAKITCKRTYNDCLKKFIKKAPLTYNAICGGKKDE